MARTIRVNGTVLTEAELIALLPTRAEVARAKAATFAERRKIFQQTGLRITEDGRITRPFIVHCAHCTHTASAQTQGRAIKALTSHILATHHPLTPETAA